MSSSRVDALMARLEKGQHKTHDSLSALSPEQWQWAVYAEPNWSVRELLAHFVSAEERLLAFAQEVVSGGAGSPEGFDLDAFNADEQSRFARLSPQALLSALNEARQQTLEWVRTLDESQLDKVGRHPALGEVNVETMILSIYGHQLFHMRELNARFGEKILSK